MKILVTGSDGFIAKNLIVHLEILDNIEVFRFNKTTSTFFLRNILPSIEFIFHFAGENRSDDENDFERNNSGLTSYLCQLIAETKCSAHIIFASSIQANLENPYGTSKRNAEAELYKLQRAYGNTVCILRLPNIFGKWCKPNYNSVIATFCHNVSMGLDLIITDPETQLTLMYVDDLVLKFVEAVKSERECKILLEPVYSITLGEVATTIRSFQRTGPVKTIPTVGVGLTRALYATYLSFLKPANFSTPLTSNSDERGCFSEIIRTTSSGQFSYFTAKPGVTRGGHYHHTKNEIFLVVNGKARFRFVNIISGERVEIEVSSEQPSLVETVPGWAHDITNIGDSELIALLWANENFEKENPDTYNFELN